MISPARINQLLGKIRELIVSAQEAEKKYASLLEKVHPDYQSSAKNLLHYLSVRSKDLRNLQDELSEIAISSLTHSEGYTLTNLYNIERILLALLAKPFETGMSAQLDLGKSRRLMRVHAEALFGREMFPGQTRLMVTLPTEAAADRWLVKSLVENGMGIARINTAHDDQAAWKKMVSNVRRASRETGIPVKIYMDLAGPKLRIQRVRTAGAASEKNNATGQAVHLEKGSRLLLVPLKKWDSQQKYPVAALSLPALFRAVRKGDPVWLDDGKFGGVVKEVSPDKILVEILDAPQKGSGLKSEKGINFPETSLKISALSDEDLENLPFMARHADMLGFSFVREERDIHFLRKKLTELHVPDMNLILKIENRRSFENLPRLLLASMRQPGTGIMIARGDLAVEVGFMRIAEVQEEIMWIADAAHIPVIWATELLDRFVKKGKASRAEISDAVKSVRAECAMLNKGPYIVDALKMLKNIDVRMAAHENKKMKTLRSLHIAFRFLQP
jgi:pyruvate kinase